MHLELFIVASTVFFASAFATVSSGQGAESKDSPAQATTDELPAPLDPESDTPGLKVGQNAPNATLLGEDGEEVQLQTLYEKGPVVITFYRGKW